MLPTYNYQPLSIPPVSFLGKGWIPLFQALGVLNDCALYKSTHSLTHSLKAYNPQKAAGKLRAQNRFFRPGQRIISIYHLPTSSG